MHHHPQVYDVAFHWPFWLALTGIVVTVGAILIFLHRRRVQPDYLTPPERKGLSALEKDILRIVRQQGAPITQTELCETVPLEPDELSELLHELETRNLIERKWVSEEQAYSIRPV